MSLPLEVFIIAIMSGVFALNVPVIVMFFCCRNPVVGTDIKKIVCSDTSSRSKQWFNQVTYYAVSQIFLGHIS